MTPATTYQKHLQHIVEEKYGTLSGGELLELLFDMGVVDFTRCKILATRQFVDALVKQGRKKTDAMWIASEHFACSYEYVRKCMYYYTDVNAV